MTVYAVHNVDDNISPALKFGDIVYINRYYIHGDELEGVRHVPRAGVDATPGAKTSAGVASISRVDWTIPLGYSANMRRVAAGFNPDSDFLLIAGDHLQLLAMSALLANQHKTFMVLRYDRKIQDYIPVRLYS